MTAPVHVQLPLPAYATLSGGVPAAGYCPACLDTWYGPSRADQPRTHLMHPSCLALIEAIHDAPPADAPDLEAAA